MIVSADGNIGIGTTTPASRLHLTDGPPDYTGQARVGGDSSSFGVVVSYSEAGATMGTIYCSPGYANPNAKLKLGVGTSNADQLVLMGDGNVGVGIAAPQATLDINGTARLSVYQAEPYGCNQARNGAIALTSKYTLCVCKLNLWVETSNGTTACVW